MSSLKLSPARTVVAAAKAPPQRRPAAAFPATGARTRSPVPHVPPPASGAAAAAPDAEHNTLIVTNAALRGGFVQLPRAILHAQGLSRDAKLLYAVLLSYAWQAGSCFPGYERLKADLGCGINQITRYMRELETARLITRRRRGQGKTTIYTLHDLPPPAEECVNHQISDSPPKRKQSHRISESTLTKTVTPQPPFRRRVIDSPEIDPEKQQQGIGSTAQAQQATKAVPATQRVVALLVEHGVTLRIARDLADQHAPEKIQQQIDWHPHRPALSKNPAGALVQAIREGWAPPVAWVEAVEREAANAATLRQQEEEHAARAAEDAERRMRLEALSPEERVRGQLEFWTTGQRLKGREPSDAQITAQQAILIARLNAAPPTTNDSPGTTRRRSGTGTGTGGDSVREILSAWTAGSDGTREQRGVESDVLLQAESVPSAPRRAMAPLPARVSDASVKPLSR